MNCHDALEIVSATLDREPTDAALLAEAKQHCKECPECVRFVRAMLAVQRAGLPEPSAGLEQRVLDAIAAVTPRPVSSPAAESISTGSPAVVPAAVPAAAPVAAAPPLAASTASGLAATLRTIWNEPSKRRSLVAWASTAAVVFIAAGVFAVQGVRTMLLPEPESVKTIIVEGSPYSVPTGAADAAAPQAEVATSGADIAATSLSASSGHLVFSGTVYRAAGSDTSVQRSSLERLGTVEVALDQEESPSSHDVLGSGDPTRVFIEADDAILAFDMVTRSFQGRTYILRGAPSTNLTAAVALPPDIPAPAAEDGSPTFEPAEGIEGVYVRSGQDASSGIALPPGSDTASSGWTWWTPSP